ncbi:MAG: glycoside hydrolase family 26 protein [Elusimicrobiota bacterium]
MFRKIATVVLMSVISTHASSKYEPPNGQTLLIIGQDIDSIRTYLQDLGKVPAGFMSYTSLENLEGLTTMADPGGGVQFAQPLVDEYPNTVWQLGLYLVGQLEGINQGRYDERIDKLGEWLRSTRRPVFLRIGYEFDLPANKYDPQQYVKAYRRIVERFRKKGITNVAFVWHSYAQGQPERFMEWYPGDDYVDWVGASYFNQFPKFVKQVGDLASRLNKPFMLAETSSWHIKNDKQRSLFFERMFAIIKEKNVKALSYINADWDSQNMWKDLKFGDGRVQPYPEVLQLWEKETSSPAFIKSSPSMFSMLGFE